MTLEVVDPGLLATIQDTGRPDAAPLGVPRAGACDPLALAAANLLLGDDPALPAIELTGGLPRLLVREDLVLAVTGADLMLRAGDGGPWVRPGMSVLLRAGTTVRATAAPPRGLRTYLALPGGVDVPRVLGSASTSPVGGFGGLVGRPLRSGDVVRGADPGRRTGAGHAWPGPGPSSGIIGGTIVLDVTDGPHAPELEAAVSALLASDWVVGADSDRVGVRLIPTTGSATGSGSPPATCHDLSLPSFALVWGAVELPPDGCPIVMLSDGPTVGGYPVPLVVIGAHLPRLGQAGPGDRVRLRRVDQLQAHAERSAADAALAEARARLSVLRSVW
jgi:biotin-dependent carboxylase-like uncharacterized protein